MSPLEDQLRSALRRKDPPAGFAAGVLEKTAKVPSHRHGLWWPNARLGAAIGAAIAAGVMIVSFSITAYEQRKEERAGRQAVAALQIASEKLNLAWDKALRQDLEKDHQ